MSTEDNKALVRQVFEQVFNQGNLALVDELYAPNFIFHDPDLPQVRTREDYKRFITETRSAFPDLHMTIDEMIAEGDQVMVRWTFSGTNTGDIVLPMPIPATGKQVTVTGFSNDRLANDKFVELWHQTDVLTFLQQLGLIPAPGQASFGLIPALGQAS